MDIMHKYIFILLSVFTLSACEDIIDVNLNEADPRYVIDANIHNLTATQEIVVSQTVAFNSSSPYKPIDDASVVIEDDKGRSYTFQSIGEGKYQANDFRPIENRNYTLSVNIGGEKFTATSFMPPYINVDSLSVVEDEVFDEMKYSVNLKFNDPKDQDNYYKYSVSVNGKPFEFSRAFSDKFNDGLFVTHQLTNKDNSLVVGDSVDVQRFIIDKNAYTYWSELQSINPGSAAPANPTSNISNGALGYFSVSSAKIYRFIIVAGKGSN